MVKNTSVASAIRSFFIAGDYDHQVLRAIFENSGRGESLESDEYGEALNDVLESVRRSGHKIRFDYRDLTGFNFNHLDLSDISAIGTKFPKKMFGVSLRRSILTKADFTNSNLSNSNLEQSVMVGANLSFSNLANSSLTWADLTGAKFMDTRLAGYAGVTTATGICTDDEA